MARDFRRFQSGDTPEPRDLNLAYAELRRLRNTSAAGGVELSGVRGPGPPEIRLAGGEHTDIRLTGPYAAGYPAVGYPWAEVLVSASGVVTPTGRVGGPATGDGAFERRIGDASLVADSTVYRARRSPASNQLVFPKRGASGGSEPACWTISGYVLDCNGEHAPGAVVTATAGGAVTPASQTTPTTGLYKGFFVLSGSTPSDTVVVTVTYGGFTNTQTVHLSGCNPAGFNICCGVGSVCLNIGIGCAYSSVPSSCNVSVTQTGFSATGTTDSSGNFCVCVPMGKTTTVTVTTSRPRWKNPAPWVFTSPGCGGVGNTFLFVPADGYACMCPSANNGGCDDPIKKTLTLTDSYLGVSCVLNWVADPTDPSNYFRGTWKGEASYYYPGYGGSSPYVQGSYSCYCPKPANITLYYSWNGCNAGVAWTTRNDGTSQYTCPGESSSLNGTYGTPGWNLSTTCPPGFFASVEVGREQPAAGGMSFPAPIGPYTEIGQTNPPYPPIGCIGPGSTLTITE